MDQSPPEARPLDPGLGTPGRVPALDPDPPGFPFAPWGPARALAMSVAALLAGMVLGLPFLLFDGDPAGDDLSLFTTVAVQVCAGLALIIVPVALAWSYGGGVRKSMRRLGFVSFRPGEAAKWIAIGIGAYFAFSIVYALVFGPPEQDDIAGDFGPIGIQILLIVLLAPLSEEICFRGMLFAGLRNRLPMWAAALGTGAVFGILHFSTGISAVPALVVLGAIFAVVYEKTGSIWPPIIMHVGNNAVALAVISST
jgi:membrane protease YdiL (CAAX protease family)